MKSVTGKPHSSPSITCTRLHVHQEICNIYLLACGYLKLSKYFLITVSFCFPVITYADETGAVTGTFDNYKSAILELKGELAVGLVTNRTVEEYQHYVDWALTADRKTMESLSLINRLQVFLLRHRLPHDLLKRMDGRAVFI